MEGDDDQSPSTSRVKPFGAFSDSPPYRELSKEVRPTGYGKTTNGKAGASPHNEHHPSEAPKKHVPKKPQTARDRERMDAGKQALRELLKERKTKKSKSTSCVSLIRLYLTIVAALLIIGGLLVLLFLVPMTIDPALATLNYDIDYEPAICLTLYSVQVKRGQGKMWCSCSEGCTKDIFFCYQITVAYRKRFLHLDDHLQGNFNKSAYYSKIGKKQPSLVDEIDESRLTYPTKSGCLNIGWEYNPECWDSVNASLLVNVKGCGYPPDVDCNKFIDSYNRTGRRFLCYYSRLDNTTVLSYYDPNKPWDDLIQSLAWTCGAQAVGTIVIFLLHCPFKNTCKSLCKKKQSEITEQLVRPNKWQDKDRVRQPVFQRDWYDVHT